MLNKSSLLASLLIFSPMLAQQAQNNVQNEPSELQKWGNFSLDYLKQLPTLAASAIIGAVTGALCGGIINKSGLNEAREYNINHLKAEQIPKIGTLLIFMISFNFIEKSIRDSIVTEAEKGYDKNNIRYNKNLIHKAAWIASWLVFLKCA